MRIFRGGGVDKNLESTENLIQLIFALFILDICLLMASLLADWKTYYFSL